VVSLLASNKLIYFIVVLSIFLKVAVLSFLGPQPFLDGQWYISTAEYIYNSGFIYPRDELKDAPLTPYFYSMFVPLSKVIGNNAYALGNIILATASIVIFSKISLLIFNSRKIANITALISCIYPFFNFYSISILTETLYIFFLYLSFYYFIIFLREKRLFHIALFAVFFALDTLTRFSNLAMFPFFVLLLIVLQYRSKETIKTIVSSVAIGSLAFVTVMSIWWTRNYFIFGEFVATSKGESGKVFYSGNNPRNNSGGGIGGTDVDFNQFIHIKDPVLRDKAMWKAGIDWIKNNPNDWLKLEFKKLIRFYKLTIHAEQYQAWYYKVLSIFSYGIVFILSIYSLFVFRQYLWKCSPMILYTFLLTGVHLVFIASVRYRLPIEPFMIILAAPVIHLLFSKFVWSSNETI